VELGELVQAARAGDLGAYARLIRATQEMVYAVARRILDSRDDALDATQEAYLRAFRGLAGLEQPAAFPGYLRRIALRAAYDLRRTQRATFAPVELALELPALDEREERWSDEQRRALATALVGLSREERRLADRFYHGGWSAARLAAAAGVSEPAMRKRLQRLREGLRQEVEMSERRAVAGEPLPEDLSDRVIELLARPALVDLPDNPVGRMVEQLRALFAEHAWVEIEEVIDLPTARARLGHDPVYVPSNQLFQLDERRILRYDLSLPLQLALAGRGSPLAVATAGKVYRDEPESPTRLSVFHQFEMLAMAPREQLLPWAFLGSLLGALDQLLPQTIHRVEGVQYPFCSRAWDISVERDGEPVEVLGCGVYSEEVVRMLGGDPAVHVAIGAGIGLERLASLHFRVSDMRTLETARISPQLPSPIPS
jgi:RNA polymerase sigma-70 factor (ECF subfamily)